MSSTIEAGSELRKTLETLMIEHTSYVTALSTLKRRVDDTFAGFLPCFELLIGASRCGKTELLKVIAGDYPETHQNGRRQVPLLVVYVNSGMGPKDLPTAVIKALGLPVPKGSVRTGELNAHMHRHLELAGVRVILFDEASHLVDVGTRIPPRAASDWFKDLQAGAKDLGMVLTGVPRLKRLLDGNEQLRNRARKPVSLMPYRWDDEMERKSFAGCVAAFLHEFQTRGYESGVPFNNLARHCYAASAGHVGLLARVFLELATESDVPCVLSTDLYARACANLNLPGNGVVLPFVTDTLSDIDLLQVLVSELDKYDLVLPPLSVETELAQAKVSATRSLDK